MLDHECMPYLKHLYLHKTGLNNYSPTTTCKHQWYYVILIVIIVKMFYFVEKQILNNL